MTFDLRACDASSARFDSLGLVGDSPAMRRLHLDVARYAPRPATVLVYGETGTGKEVVTRFTAPSLVTAANFSTDSNCREMVPRTRNVRYSWNYTVYEPVAGNYAPVNCRITTRDTAV